jgi:hypothetical protein
MASGHVALMSVHTGTVVPIVLSYTFVDIIILKGRQIMKAAENE